MTDCAHDGGPLVSVVVPAWNAEASLGRALESALAQDWSRLEVIVVDDGSSDGTASVARGFGERVRLVGQENAGPAAARNRGVAEARGDYVAFLDADDEYLPGRIAKGVAPLLEDRGVALTHCQCRLRYPDGREELSGERFRRMEPFTSPLLLDARYQSTPSATIRRDLFLELGGFDERLRNREDHDLWLRVRERYREVHVPEPLVRVHRAAASLSAGTAAGDKAESVLGLIERALERAPEFYASEQGVMRAWAQWHAGLIHLGAGEAGRARGLFLGAFRERPGLRLLALWGLTLIPGRVLDRMRQGRKRHKKVARR